MKSFFKTFFSGILIIICLPLIAVLLALGVVVCAIAFVVVGIRSIIVFFSGGKPFGDLKEDVLAKQIIRNRQETALAATQPQYINPQIQPQFPQESQSEPIEATNEINNPFEKYEDTLKDIPSNNNDNEGGNL